MFYLVNDIENMKLLNGIGFFNETPMACNSMSITNFRLGHFSPYYVGTLKPLFDKGLTVEEVDEGFYKWCDSNKIVLKRWGVGERSTLYVAKKEKSIVVSDNLEFHEVAKIFEVECILTDDFAKLFTANLAALNLFINHKLV